MDNQFRYQPEKCSVTDRRTHRRGFLGTSAAMLATSWVTRRHATAAQQPARLSQEQLDAIAHARVAPVLPSNLHDEPLIISSIELLQNDRHYLLRTRTKQGLEVITVPNPSRLAEFYPVFEKRIAPFFIGKDARDLESLLWDVYRHRSNYKLQGISLWCGIAAIEMALLEILGRATGQALADFFGGQIRRDIPVYYASSNRGNQPEEEIEHLHRLIGTSGVKAIKFRLGGRMSRNSDSPPDRTERLIPLATKTFGSDLTLYGDSNSSYQVDEAIRIGRMLEEHGYGFYEEPCEFDDLWSTKQVSKSLQIPIAGGEQEFSMHRWTWAIKNQVYDIVQPDLHYGGGFIRATRVARMAAAANMQVVPHMSGGGLGYVDVVQFASFTPNIGPFMEFKGNANFPVGCESSSLRCENGIVTCPTGPGLGVQIDPEFVAQSQLVCKAD